MSGGDLRISDSFTIHAGERVTKRGILNESAPLETQPITNPDQLNEMYTRIVGTHIHAGAAELARNKIFHPQNVLEIPRNVTSAYRWLMGNPHEELTHADASMRIAKKLAKWDRSTDLQPLNTVIKWAQSIHEFSRPNLQIHPHFERENLDIEPELLKRCQEYYALTMVIMAHDETMSDPNTLILPEIGIYPHVRNINRIISTLEEPKQNILPHTGVNKKTLDAINIFDAIGFRKGIDKHEKLRILDAILQHDNDPTFVLYTASDHVGSLLASLTGEPIDDRLDIDESDTFALTMQLQALDDWEFVQYANENMEKNIIDGADLPALCALYVFCKAQAEIQYYIGEEASVSDIKDEDELLNVLYLSKRKIDASSVVLPENNQIPEKHVVPFSGRLDYLMISFVPQDGVEITPEQMEIRSQLWYRCQELYTFARQPNLQDSVVLMLLDQGIQAGNMELRFGDFKSMIYARAPQEVTKQHYTEMHYYLRMFLQILYARRRTTHRINWPDQPFQMEDLIDDPIAQSIRAPEVFYVGGLFTQSGTYPEVSDLLTDEEIDLSAIVDQMHTVGKQVSQSEQLRKSKRK